MDIVLVILVLVLVLIIPVIRAILKRDDDTSAPPPLPPTLQPPTNETRPPVQLLSGSRRPQRDFHTTPPPIPDKIPSPFDYNASWWRKYSYWVREQKGWQCDECGFLLKDDHEMLQTHHVYGVKYNKIHDLQALCIGCHAEQPGEKHRRLKKRHTYKSFMKKHGKQWREYCEQMGFEL